MRFPPPSVAFLLAAGSLFASAAAHAATFGSQTKVAISAVYTLPNPPTVVQFPSGAYRQVDTVNTVRYGNKEILETLVKRQLIPSIKGYSIVMLRTARGTHSYTFVAAHKTAVNVRIPDDLLDLAFADGPEKGRYEYNAQGVVTRLGYETRNLASLKLEGYEGQAILRRKSGFKNLTRNGETHTIKLDSAKASFDGAVTVADATGVGVVTLTLSDARITDLEDFGEAAPDGEEDEAGGDLSALTVGGTFAGGTLTLDSSPWASGGFEFSEITGILEVSAIGDAGEASSTTPTP